MEMTPMDRRGNAEREERCRIKNGRVPCLYRRPRMRMDTFESSVSVMMQT
jgi:hypothetical protein